MQADARKHRGRRTVAGSHRDRHRKRRRQPSRSRAAIWAIWPRLYDQQGNYAAALPLYRQSFEINDRVLSGILNVGSESTKAEVLANLDDPLPALLAFQQRAGDQLPEARVLAFEAVARRKGRVLDHVRDWRESLRENSAADVRDRLSSGRPCWNASRRSPPRWVIAI